MRARFFGGFLIFLGLGIVVLGVVNYLGYGLGLDGNTPIFAVGLIFVFLGWIEWGRKPADASEATKSSADDDRPKG